MKTYTVKFFINGDNRFTTSVESDSYDNACSEATLILAKTKIYDNYQVFG